MRDTASGSSTSSTRIVHITSRTPSTLVLASLLASSAACNAKQNGSTTATPGSAGTYTTKRVRDLAHLNPKAVGY